MVFFPPLKKTNKHTQEHNKHNAILVHFWEYLIRTTQHKSILKLHNKFIPFKNSLGFKSKQKLLSDREIIELQPYARILAVTKNRAILCCQSHRGSSRLVPLVLQKRKTKIQIFSNLFQLYRHYILSKQSASQTV